MEVESSAEMEISQDTSASVVDGSQTENANLLAELQIEPPINLDSSMESVGSSQSKEEAKAANNQKELYINSDNMAEQFTKLAKKKYLRPYPPHTQPAIQELLAKMNGSDIRMYKFIDDSGLYSSESILALLDLEKRIVKQNKINPKNGKRKLTKLTEDERAKLKTSDVVNARWIVQDKDKDTIFYPAIITEKVKLYLDETELIESKLREWNLLEDRHLTETFIKELSNLDSMIDIIDDIEIKTKRLIQDKARSKSFKTSYVAQQEITDRGSISKTHLGIDYRSVTEKILYKQLGSKEAIIEFLDIEVKDEVKKATNSVTDAFADFLNNY